MAPPKQTKDVFHGWHDRDVQAWKRALSMSDDPFGVLRPRLCAMSPRVLRATQTEVTSFLSWAEKPGLAIGGGRLALVVSEEKMRLLVRERLPVLAAGTLRNQVYHLILALEMVAFGDTQLDPFAEAIGDSANTPPWLNNICRRLSTRARREPPKARSVVHAARLFELGIHLIEKVIAAGDRGDPRMFRDGLAIALLASAPMRIENFSCLELGRHVVGEGGHWSIQLGCDETKTRQPDLWPVPAELTGHLEHYIGEIRPSLLGRSHTGCSSIRLWIGNSGQPIGQQVLRRIIARNTEIHLGVKVNPHSFRHCAATTFGLEHPEDAMQTAALLGHTSMQTTQRHYIIQQRHLTQLKYLAVLSKRRQPCKWI